MRNEERFQADSKVVEIAGTSDGRFLLVFGAGGVVVCDEEDATGAEGGGFGGEECVCGEEDVGHGRAFFGGFAEVVECFIVYSQNRNSEVEPFKRRFKSLIPFASGTSKSMRLYKWE